METTSPAPKTPTRAGIRPRDMAFAMVVLLVPVFILVALFRFLGHEEPPIIDAEPAYESIEAAGRFPVLRHGDLPDGYYVQSATVRNGVLRVGMQTPDEGGLQIIETNEPADQFVPATLGQGARPGELVEVNGRSWQQYAGGREGERAYVLLEPDRTVIVLGRSSDAELKRVVDSLH